MGAGSGGSPGGEPGSCLAAHSRFLDTGDGGSFPPPPPGCCGRWCGSIRKRGFSFGSPRERGEAFGSSSNYRGEGMAFFATALPSRQGVGGSGGCPALPCPLGDGGYARFVRWEVSAGSRFVPGEYSAEVALYPRGGKGKPIRWKGAFTYAPGGRRKLSRSLANWRKKLIAPLEDQLHRYGTFRSLLDNTHRLYRGALKAPQAATWHQFAALFEEGYNREVGPLLRDLILDGEKLHLIAFLTETGSTLGATANWLSSAKRSGHWLPIWRRR